MNDRTTVNVGDDSTMLGLKRAGEMAAVFMIGDGLLGILQPTRHVDLWRSKVGIVDALVSPFGGKPTRRRLYGLVQLSAGIALAATLRPRKEGGDGTPQDARCPIDQPLDLSGTIC